jgi:hypothetical protein
MIERKAPLLAKNARNGAPSPFEGYFANEMCATRPASSLARQHHQEHQSGAWPILNCRHNWKVGAPSFAYFAKGGY